MNNNDLYQVSPHDTKKEGKGGTGWIWIFVIIIVIIIIAAIIALIIWGVRRDDDKNVSVEGVVFSVVNDRSITATWTSTSNSDDELVLYAAPSNEKMTFNSSGVPQGAFLNSGIPTPSTPGSIPTTISASVRTATVSGLTIKANYIASLVVTNPNSNNSDIKPSPVLPVSGGPIPVVFKINASGQTGAIRYDPSSKPTSVGYELGTLKVNNVKFHQGTGGHICVASSGSWTETSVCDSTSHVLYADTANELNIAERGDLATSATTTANPVTETNSQWVYTNGKWCLKNNVSTCMLYDITQAGTAFDADVVLPSEADDTTTTPTVQKIKITTSSDATKWNNEEIKP